MGTAQPALGQVDAIPPGPSGLDVPPPPPSEEAGIETLTQGPLHEAFANPASLDPTPTPLVDRQPPPDVPEQPPEYAPEGNSVWISGYWMWDDGRSDFIWVTGVWREIPPGMRWVPGYWTQVDTGWQRVPGFWASNEVTEVEYRPNAPPGSLETGPSSPAPSDDYFWIPGSWTVVNSAYVWQAGYWAPFQPNWVWVPARWSWCPAGYVYLPGFWDYRLPYRGQIFAPVAFRTALYTQPNWFYRPSYVIPTTNLFIHLWLRPQWGSYYFGNYYGQQYASQGFLPWANLSATRGQRYVYDPLYTYANVHYRQQGVDFLGRVQGWHNYYAQHADARPAGTWLEQQRLLSTHATNNNLLQTQLVARTITEAARSNDSPMRLTRLDSQALQAQIAHVNQQRDLNTERRQLERQAVHAGSRGDDGRQGSRALDRTERSENGPRVEGGRPGAGPVAAGQPTHFRLPQTNLPAARASSVADAPNGGPRHGAAPPPRPTSHQSVLRDRGTNPQTEPMPDAQRPGTRNLPQAADGRPGAAAESPLTRTPGSTDPIRRQDRSDQPDRSGPTALDRIERGNNLPQVGRPQAARELPQANPLAAPVQPNRPGTNALDRVERGNNLPHVDRPQAAREVPQPNPLAPPSNLPTVDGSRRARDLTPGVSPSLVPLQGNERVTSPNAGKGKAAERAHVPGANPGNAAVPGNGLVPGNAAAIGRGANPAANPAGGGRTEVLRPNLPPSAAGAAGGALPNGRPHTGGQSPSGPAANPAPSAVPSGLAPGANPQPDRGNNSRGGNPHAGLQPSALPADRNGPGSGPHLDRGGPPAPVAPPGNVNPPASAGRPDNRRGPDNRGPQTANPDAPGGPKASGKGKGKDRDRD